MIMLTVLFSVVLHGITARPLAGRYGELEANQEGDEPASNESVQHRYLGEHHGDDAGTTAPAGDPAT